MLRGLGLDGDDANYRTCISCRATPAGSRLRAKVANGERGA